MEHLERPSGEVWDERRLWFEETQARHARAGAAAPSEQACALMIDLQSVFCAGAWAATVMLACAVTEAQGGSKRETLPGVADRDYRWLRALRNRLSHENRNDPELTVEDQWLRRDLWEERARRAVVIAFSALYPAAGERASEAGDKA
ncbi:hypothetical protein [Pelagibius marinus]|uniref:hypothetical protein n=1 Tax=Pelagibius marinus TaxID=2762760 RepID=UPI001872EDD2|nr:hypothetical protein [Pelagibius marinus]